MKKNTPIPEFPDQYKNDLKARIQDDFTTKIADSVRGVALDVLSVALQDLVRDSDREYMQVRSAAYFLKSTDCNIWYDFLNIEIEDGRAITDKYIKMYVKPGLNAWERYQKKKKEKHNNVIRNKKNTERKRAEQRILLKLWRKYYQSYLFEMPIDRMEKHLYIKSLMSRTLS